MDSREERFRRLYDTGRHRVIAYAIRRTGNYEDTADVVAETFAIAWRRLDEIPIEDREVPWLLVVARKIIANRLRSNATQSAIVQRLARQLAISGPGEEEPDAERLSALSALSELSEDDREILMLAGWDGLNSQELGWVLSCSATAARIRLYRARARLTHAWAGGRLVVAHPPAKLKEAPDL